MADFKLTPALEKELEKIAKSLPEKDFKDKYGKDWMQVKMATAMNILKKKHGYKTEDKMNFKELREAQLARNTYMFKSKSDASKFEKEASKYGQTKLYNMQGIDFVDVFLKDKKGQVELAKFQRQFWESLDEKYRSKFASSLVAKAVEIALSMGGNMTGAYKKIEALKKGLGDDPIVKGALKTANENTSVTESKASRLAIREKELNLKIKELKLRALMKAAEESDEEKKVEKKESTKTFKDLRNELEEAKRPSRGKVTLDIDYIGDRSDIQQAERKYKIKIKMKGKQMADVSGDKQNLYNFLKGPDYGMDELDIEEIFPELFESKINEGRNEVVKGLEGLVKRGGYDKKDYQKALDLYKSAKYNDLRKHIYSLDTEPSEAIASVINQNDSKAFNSMYPRAKAGDYLRSIVIQHGGK